MDIGSILLGLALLLGVAFIVARPLLDQAGAAAREPGPAEALLFERERILTALRDLDFDHATGKFLDDDYAAQRAQLLAQGADVLRQLDALAPAAGPIAEPAPTSVDAEIEQAIARRRAHSAPAAPPRRAMDTEIEAAIADRRQSARFCAQCGQPLRPDDKFCGACGAAVQAAAEGA